MEKSSAKPKILLTYIESGMGHIMSMKSIEDGLKPYADQLEIISSYIMQEDQNEVCLRFEKFLINCTKGTNKSKIFSHTVFFLMSALGKIHLMRILHHSLFKKASDATIQAMLKYHPDAVISTHYFITFCAIELKKKYLPNLQVITYNPDNNVHVWWDNRSDIFINNNSKACNEAIKKRKFDYSKVRQVFFTARQEIIDSNLTKEQCREKYHIDSNFTIIIADGAYASGKAKKACNAILKTKKKINILFVAGKNEKMAKYFNNKVNKLKKKKPNIHLVVLPFQPKIYELYRASDLFITKAGPNAILDCVFMNTPILVDYYAHPIEKATANLFINTYKCGVAVYKTRKMLHSVEHLIDHPEELAKYQENTKKIDKYKNGSSQVAEIILQQVIGLDSQNEG